MYVQVNDQFYVFTLINKKKPCDVICTYSYFTLAISLTIRNKPVTCRWLFFCKLLIIVIILN